MSSDLIPAFLSDMSARRLAPQSVKTYCWILQDYEHFLKDKPLESATRVDLKAYMDLLRARPCSHKTASCYFTALQSFYDFLLFEEIIDKNPVEAVRKRYLQSYKAQKGHTHQLISVEDAARLVDSMVDIRNKCILMLLLKTGIRCKELVELDVGDVDLRGGRIALKPTPKRTNRVVFFDEEAAELLRRWLKVRAHRVADGEAALFASSQGRLQKYGVAGVLRNAAKRLGLHDASSPDMEKHFSPHSCRHFYTTMLDRNGMEREHIQFLRGDVGKDVIDIYIHNDLEEIRKEYLKCMPRLGL